MPKSKSSPRVRFHYLEPIRLAGSSAIKDVVARIGETYKKPNFSIDYIFCGDEYLLGLNRQFLEHDYYTDVVSFDLSNGPDEVQGEIYISVDRVRENAKELGVSVQQEVCRVIFHGALHLCGFRDKTKQDILAMRKAEDRFLSLLETKTKLFHVKQKRKRGFT